MGRLTDQPFKESCCDGGACVNDSSAQPCGCDKGANYTCAWHQGEKDKKVQMVKDLIQRGYDTATAFDKAEEMIFKQDHNTTIEQWKEISAKVASNYELRKFDTGATRDSVEGKPDYEGFLSPLVIDRFAQYMNKHRVQPDGQLRNSDNWQLGIPQDAYMKSGFRHFMDWWRQHRGYKGQDTMEESLCALMFNVQGYLHELLKNGR